MLKSTTTVLKLLTMEEERPSTQESQPMAHTSSRPWKNVTVSQLGCMAHVLNLAAQAGIKAFSQPSPPSPERPLGLSNILNDCPATVERTTSGLIWKDLGMIQDVSTRWNSAFDMVQRALELHSCISAHCASNSLTNKFDLHSEEWDKVQQLCNFLRPLSDAIEMVSPDETTTMVIAAPVYMEFVKDLAKVLKRYNAQELVPSANTMLE
ncbi:hypothetical protein Pst134EA_031695, partial [Puccinia striiformis f. sp. tritici]|uniref:uncharacterized protein n=1 Tax=Puccinia striiformis f. sp. tritici TaxID=168172 RepID=UPI0020088AD1